MDPWPFVAAAYGLTLAGMAGVSWWAWRAVRAAERLADAGRGRD